MKSDSARRQQRLCSKHLTACGGLLLCLLAACGNRYQAPVTEAGQRQVITPPLIVNSSTGNSSSPAELSRPTVVSSVNSPARNSGGSAQTMRPDVHIVRRGETLFSIAFQHDLDFRSLAIANDLSPPYTIFVDQELLLDVSQVGRRQIQSLGSNIGTPAPDNSVARTRAGGGSGGVIRQPIQIQRDPVWQWPHDGSIVRGFNEGGSEGLDIAGRVGDPVRAAGAGDVVYSGRGIQGVGNLIIIRHNDRLLSAYGNNSAILVAQGQHVEAGEEIAEVGENSRGEAVLHFEIREEGKSVDPTAFLP
jgi:lipoprotein NlpD